MHLPDGFLSLPVAAGVGAASAAAVGLALRKCRDELDDRAEALLGVTAAGVFAAQMVNFPIPGGTSGHLLGGTLAGVVLGPWAGLVAMTCVLIVQCFLFADGGLLALGTNVFNMGVVGCIGGAAIWSLLRPLGRTPVAAAAVVAFSAWCATVLGAAACALELSVSGTFGFTRTLSLMVGIHSVIGLGEALITGLVVAALIRRGRFALPSPATGFALPPLRPASALIGGTALAATIVVLLAPFSSTLPDGLERALELLGADRAVELETQTAQMILFGLLGLVIVTVSCLAMAKIRFLKPAPAAPSR